jgi:DNA-binding PadR family transcriptional regulator
MGHVKRNDCVILGLLSHSPMTGYEIKKRMEYTMKYFWNASFGSIYPTLKQLEEEGKISSAELEDNGRNKIVYQITEIGRKSLQNWLSEPVVKDELRYETLLKLFFGGDAGADITLEHIDAFERRITNELPAIQEMIKTLQKLSQEEDHLYYMLTARFGVKIYEASLEWCQEVKEQLKKTE